MQVPPCRASLRPQKDTKSKVFNLVLKTRIQTLKKGLGEDSLCPRETRVPVWTAAPSMLLSTPAFRAAPADQARSTRCSLVLGLAREAAHLSVSEPNCTETALAPLRYSPGWRADTGRLYFQDTFSFKSWFCLFMTASCDSFHPPPRENVVHQDLARETPTLPSAHWMPLGSSESSERKINEWEEPRDLCERVWPSTQHLFSPQNSSFLSDSAKTSKLSP